MYEVSLTIVVLHDYMQNYISYNVLHDYIYIMLYISSTLRSEKSPCCAVFFRFSHRRIYASFSTFMSCSRSWLFKAGGGSYIISPQNEHRPRCYLFVITNLAGLLGLFSHSCEQNPILFLNLSSVRLTKTICQILHTLTSTRMRTALCSQLEHYFRSASYEHQCISIIQFHHTFTFTY